MATIQYTSYLYGITYNKHSSSAFSAVVSLLLFCCCCLIFVCIYLAFDLRLCLHEDHDEDQDEAQDDKTKIKTAMNTKIKAKTQHTHLVTITEATLVILDLHLRRALFLFEDTGAIAAEELTIASSVDRVEVKVGANRGDAGFFGV